MRNRFIVIFAAVSCVLIVVVFLNQHKFFTLSSGSKAQEQDSDIPILILGLVGQGEGGKWHEAPNLTDTIILADYHPTKKVLDLISIPRDLYGDFGGETFKVNEVVERDKISGLLAKLPDITGIKTDKYLITDLDFVKTVIDDLGGVDVTLTAPVTDSVSGYTMSAGEHHLSGADAIWVIRNRFAKEGDFFREDNQHVIIKAAIGAFEKLNPIEQAQFLFKLTPSIDKVKTNLDIGTVLPLSEGVSGLKFKDVVLDFSTGLLVSSSTLVGNSRAYILVPKLGIDKYGDIKKFITASLVN